MTEPQPSRYRFSFIEHLAPAKLRLLLLVFVTVLTARHITEGGFRFADAPRHAMDGVLFLDMVTQGGYTDPVAFGEQFYAHYPCLGFPYYYPPLFAIVEAGFFAFFGPLCEMPRPRHCEE